MLVIDRSPRNADAGWLDRLRAAIRVRRHWLALRTATPLHYLGTGCTPGVGILTYHRLAPHSPVDRHLLNVTPSRFEQQLTGLVRMGYRPLSLARVVDLLRDGGEIPGRSFVVVFDDGYANVYHHAFPILRQLDIPATLFLPTAYLDSREPMPFDTVVHPGAPDDFWRPLTTDQCREMLASGLIELGSHTHSHDDFRGRPEAFSRDLRISLEVLADRFQLTKVPFAFPFGYVDPQLELVVRQSGVTCALTAEGRVIERTSDPFRWGRFGATEFDTPRSLAAKLDGWFTWLQEIWSVCRGKRPDRTERFVTPEVNDVAGIGTAAAGGNPRSTAKGLSRESGCVRP